RVRALRPGVERLAGAPRVGRGPAVALARARLDGLDAPLRVHVRRHVAGVDVGDADEALVAVEADAAVDVEICHAHRGGVAPRRLDLAARVDAGRVGAAADEREPDRPGDGYGCEEEASDQTHQRVPSTRGPPSASFWRSARSAVGL